MIPAIVPPLTGLSVLVTRPQPQASALAASIAAFGGDPVVLPALAIEPLEVVAPDAHDLVIFVSAHAVQHGGRYITKSESTKIAAIGQATAHALATANLPADFVPISGSTSEALLEHPLLATLAVQRVLIVRGEGGREALREAFTARGATVTALEVYRRVRASASTADINALETRWAEHEIDVVTTTSVDTFIKLTELLTDRGRELLRATPLLAPTERILDAAREWGWNGEGLVSGGADDAAILGTLARWRARARVMPLRTSEGRRTKVPC